MSLFDNIVVWSSIAGLLVLLGAGIRAQKQHLEKKERRSRNERG